jgi:queuine tRNA-ribosyltransferase
MLETLEATVPHLPAARPRYLMGVGKPIDLLEAVLRGVDMFDCVIPTRSGRHGQVWADDGPYNIKKACFAEDDSSLDPSLPCAASTDYSKAYIHHLIRSQELLGAMLLSWHNIAYFQGLMARMRAAISAGEMDIFAAKFKAGMRG